LRADGLELSGSMREVSSEPFFEKKRVSISNPFELPHTS
jgi:hypothetical protein